MDYLKAQIQCTPSMGEMLMAELAQIGFESFIETDEGIEAYIQVPFYESELLREVISRYGAETPLSFSIETMPRVNWNEEWEKNYDPILVDDKIYVRASFHPKKEDVAHEIIINPKMSFGTGHHATTYLMLKLLLGLPMNGKRVLDAGAGTGILAIMSHRLGASEVEAFDIDDWCVENGNENFDINGLDDIRMGLGNIREVDPKGPFDVILANINKNVLLDEMGEYAQRLKPGGCLFLSGFYQWDIPDLLTCAAAFGLAQKEMQTKNDWSALILGS